MRCRNIYLRIEAIPAYTPVAPLDGEHGAGMRDCMRGHGHEDARVPLGEAEQRRLDALVYREYLDPGYTTPKPDPIVAADVNEPRWERRIPGAVIYAEPGERLFVHVRNADVEPRSFHVHGLLYGIDSDGSWPFGVASADGRRGDAICPGEEWCYVLDATRETIGAWPFHDHVMDIQAVTDRGLFGAIIVRDPDSEPVDYEVPFFLHRLVGSGRDPLFDSGLLQGGETFSHTFADPGTYQYVCKLHPMLGTVRVTAAGPAAQAVAILDNPTPRFDPDDVTIGAGGTVTWSHAGTMPHTVSDAQTSSLDSYALNGRTYVGNTPTIVAESGKRIRWYVFNLDLGERWHNFHTHGQRWQVGDELMDTRTLGPAESFVVDTVVPPVVLAPIDCDDHSHSKPKRKSRRPKHKGRHLCLRGDFLVHCHVEMHMMMGMVALVRAIQEVELDDDQIAALGFELPVADPELCALLGHEHPDDHGHGGGGGHGGGAHGGHGGHGGGAHGGPRPAGHGGHGHGGPIGGDCPDVPPHPCHEPGEGRWERLPDLDIFVVHAAVLHTGKVLLWSGTAEVGDPLESRLWDPATDARTAQAYGEDLFCSGHAFLADGRLCVAGGAPAGVLRSTHIFDPVGETWTKVSDMNQARWYPTVLTLPDGRVLAASGSGASEVEVYDPAADAWTLVAGATRPFPELYPSLHLLPSGEIFYSRAGWAQAEVADVRTAYLAMTGPTAGAWTPLGQQQFHDRQEGMGVLQIDTTATPPATSLWVVGGGVSGAATARNPQSVERIDLTSLTPAPAWDAPSYMAYPRANVSAVLLPDGTIFIVGGQRAGKWHPTDPQPVLEAEILDPATGSFAVTPPMEFPRQYHSVAVLLPDGRVLCAGGVDPPNAVERDQRQMEVFSPAYLDRGPRPTIANAPASGTYGSDLTIDTPDAARIASVALIRPGSVTHHTDAGHRYITLPIVATTAASADVRLPADAQIAPPGHYMLFIVDEDGVPSVARFVHLA